MKKSKILLIIIPLVIIVLAFVGGFVYLKFNNSPQKIFQNVVNKTFKYVETKQKQYETVGENIEITANIESEDESIKELNNLLSSSKIALVSELNLKDYMSHQNINVVYNGADLVMQD